MSWHMEAGKRIGEEEIFRQFVHSRGDGPIERVFNTAWTGFALIFVSVAVLIFGPILLPFWLLGKLCEKMGWRI